MKKNRRNNKKVISLEPGALCPCGRNNAAVSCCMMPDGSFWKKPPDLKPKLPLTNFSHPECYLNKTQNCSKEISGEHFLSEAILEQIGMKGPNGGVIVNVDGFHWLPSGQSKDIGVRGLESKILCKNHNSNLSPLDDAVTRFFTRMRNGLIKPSARSLSRKATATLTSGDALEKWLLKLALGMFFSKSASRDGKALIEEHILDDVSLSSILADNSTFSKGCGLYVKSNKDFRFNYIDAINLTPLSQVNLKKLVGVRVRFFGGIELQLIFDRGGINIEQLSSEGWIYRPSEITVWSRRQVEAHHISWPIGTKKVAINLTKS